MSKRKDRSETNRVARLDYDETGTHTSEAATWFKLAYGEQWIPNSVIVEVDPDEKQVVVQEWWAIKTGLV